MNRNNYRNARVQQMSPYRLWVAFKDSAVGPQVPKRKVYYAKNTIPARQARMKLEALVERHWEKIERARLYEGATNTVLEEWIPDEEGGR